MSNKLIQTLKRREEFIENKRKGVSKKTPFFVLRISDSDQDLINVGFVVTKKGISKKAVVRNRVKRRLREVARAVLSEMGETGKVYVFYARQEAETGDFSGMKEALKKCLNSLS